MEHYNSLNVLPFYEDLKYQNGKKWYAYGSVFPLISRNDAVIPFQLIVQDDIASVISFSVVDAKSGSEVYSELTKPEIINKFSSLGYSVIKLKETAFPGSYTLKSGTYYLILKLQGSSKQYTYYSEVFVACDSVENYLKITYWNDDNIYYTGGEINYEGDFKFVCYIQATIGKPDYDFEEELTKRGGYSFLESQISSKTYKFKFIAPEFLCDGLRLVRLSDYIQISENGRNYNALTFAYEPEWQAQGDLASVEAEFTVDNIIQKIASFNRRVKESFYNALLVDVNTPLGFDDESIAQYYKSYIQGSGVSNLVNGLLIRELEELKEYKDNYYAVLDTGEGAAKKILLSNLLAGIGENIDTSNFVTTDATEQNVLGVKNFNAGITIGSSKIKAYEKDGCLFIDGNLALTGGLTMYAAGTQGVGSIYDGLPIDNDTIYWEVVDGSKVLKAKGGGGEAGSVQWDNISGKPTWIGDTKPTYNWSEIQGEKPFYTKEEIAEKYVTIDTEQEISGLKHFTPGLSIGKSKKKIYEEEGVVYIDADVAVTGGMTFYATAGRSVSTIMDAVAVDGITIKKENNVLKAVAGAGSSFDENAMWVALATSNSEKQIDKSHITTALTGYATESWVSQNYATASALASVSNKLNDFLEGSDTDEIINKWKELEAFLSGMAETDNLAEILETKADKKYVDSTFVTLGTKQTITGEKTFSSVLNTAAIKASGEITTPSLAASDYVTIAGIKLRKLEDGALMLEGNLALTGALTMYASNGQSFDTIYDGLPIDNDTIYWQEVDGSRVLKAREGSGSSFDKSAMWTALAGSTTEQINKSHLTTALTGYATESWVSGKNYAVKATTLAGYGITDGVNAVSVTGTGNAVTAASISGHTLTLTKGSTFSLSGHKHAWSDITSGKPTTLSGYGITDAYTKTDADSRYVNVSGDTMTGNLRIQLSGRKDALQLFQSGTTDKVGLHLEGSDGSLHSLYLTTSNLTWKDRTVWDSGNDGSGSGLDADLLDGTHKTGLLTALSTSSATNLSITVGGTTKKITDLYAYASTKLETARTLWGQSFDGTKNVSGDLTSVGNITGSGTFSSANTKVSDSVYINGIRLHKTADGVITLEGNLAVTGGVTMYAIDPVSASTIMDGVVVDGTTIAKVDGVLKVLNAGGGEAGSVAWGNISGKPSVFATNIANITDLHSSWDSVLAAQKPAWLTAVSIATISDLHANWDALLKAAPSAYVTRWPTISEVTNKQNLIVKLNGGTTEGTNQFTYNATAAKTINITASSVGAAASSHNHSWRNITSGKPTTLAGYGITDAPTKTGSGASGTWSISISGNASNADKLDGTHKRSGNTYWGVIPYVESDGTFEVGKYIDFHNSSTGTIDYSTRLQCDGDHSNTLILPIRNGNLALLSDNVASATKLQTARTIWGQSFDGTNNVTGNIDIGNNDIIGYAGARIIQNLGVNIGINPSGYVGIGTTSPSYKLHVNGGIYASGEIRGARYILEDNTSTNLGASEIFTSNLSSIRYSSDGIYVNGNTFRPIIRWGDILNGRGYHTRYVFGSVRDDTNDWGRIFMAVSNNDAGSSFGCVLSIYGSGYVGISGNLLVTGGGTFYSSDIRYKSIMQQVNLSLLDIAKAPSFVYRWNKKGMKRDRLNLGGSAQYTQSILPWAVENSNNFLSMDYATVAYTFAVHTARHLLTYESRTDKKIKKLEREIVILKKQLKKLGYEEVRTLDDQ